MIYDSPQRRREREEKIMRRGLPRAKDAEDITQTNADDKNKKRYLTTENHRGKKIKEFKNYDLTAVNFSVFLRVLVPSWQLFF